VTDMAMLDRTSFVLKVCGITTEQDALFAASAGANAIGLNFYAKSSRFVTVEEARRIAAVLPQNVSKVGVFVNESAERIVEVARTVPLDVVQLHGPRMPATLPASLRVWQAISVDEHFSAGSVAVFKAEAYLLDTPSPQGGGSGRTFDWSRAAGVSERVVLAGGLDGENVSKAIAQLRPWGVDACSRLEFAPGKKNEAKVRQFVSAALSAFATLKGAAEPLVVR
jgi:phosphoribosylanthranilate isomerase